MSLATMSASLHCQIYISTMKAKTGNTPTTPAPNDFSGNTRIPHNLSVHL